MGGSSFREEPIRMSRRRAMLAGGALSAIAAVAAAVVAAGGAGLAAQPAPQAAPQQAPPGMHVVPYSAAHFVPADPARPEGAQIAVLRGDPGTGPSDMLMKMKKTPGALHVHSSDYRLVLLSGRMKHWNAADGPQRSRELEAGSYWFQPGNEPHGDSCLTAECLMFISWSGKRDGRLVDAATPAPAAPVPPKR